MILLSLLSFMLCIPGAVALVVLKSGNTQTLGKVKLALFGYSGLLFLCWLGLSALTVVGFGVGGGAPKFWQIATGALIITLPLLVAALFTLVSGIILARRQNSRNR